MISSFIGDVRLAHVALASDHTDRGRRTLVNMMRRVMIGPATETNATTNMRDSLQRKCREDRTELQFSLALGGASQGKTRM